jgi:hypothetical protein
MKLLYFNCDPRIEVFGNTNNVIIVEINDNNPNNVCHKKIVSTHIIVIDFCIDIRTDNDLANAIQKALNNHDYGGYPISFLVTNVVFENIITSAIPEEEMITVVYTIIPSMPCTISFDHKDSIGPLIGMGNGRFCDSTIVEGCRTHSITQYKLIQTYNPSGNAIVNSETPVPDPLVNPNLDHECCCELPPIEEIDCGIGFHDGYDKGWNDKTNNIPFAVPYLHFYNCEWDNQHYNYGWVFGYLLGYQDKTLNIPYRNDFNCHIYEDCGIKDRMKGYACGYMAGKCAFENGMPFSLTFQHCYRHSYTNENYNFAYNIGFYTGYNDADHKIFDLCYPVDTNCSHASHNSNCSHNSKCSHTHSKHGHCAHTHCSRNSHGNTCGRCKNPDHGRHCEHAHSHGSYGSHQSCVSNEHSIGNRKYHKGKRSHRSHNKNGGKKHRTRGYNKGSHKAKSHVSIKGGRKIGINRHGGSHDCRHHDEHFTSYNCNHNGSHCCGINYTGNNGGVGHVHNGSHTCKGVLVHRTYVGSNHNGSYNGNLAHCHHTGSHHCDEKYTGRHKHGGSKHDGSHNCADSNHNGSYHNSEDCNHNGSHVCGSHYKGCRKPHGSKHNGSHNCKGSMKGSHFNGSNFHGSYCCNHKGSHKCKGSHNILFRRMPEKKCGDCECCISFTDCEESNGTIGNGDNGCECPQPVWTSYNDLNCKMMLYDSTNNPIQNLNYPGFDTTISLHSGTLDIWNYDEIQKFLRDLEKEMNRHKTKYLPYAKFEINYNYNTQKITIKNKTGAKFGIGFNFLKAGNFITTGSLHKILGFEQEEYLGLTEYTSTYKPLIFDRTFSDDHILICADLIRKDQDNNIDVIGLGNPNFTDMNNVLYAIPLSQCKNFRPINSLDSFIDLSESKFMINDCDIECCNDIPIEVNFYIRLMSGRHLKLTSNWTSTLKIEFFPVRSS